MSTLDEKHQEALANKDSDGVIQRLRDALENKSVVHEPWTSGVLTLPESETTLFYERQDGTSTSLKLGSITETQAQDLSRACSPATFGLNNQDVFDKSYRKAGKLDVGKFAWSFSPASHSDFTVQLISGLFPSDSLRKGIRFELYKLNVYGEGSFFKVHQDTPRSEDMFGSLVCLLPSAHEGGNLLLSHRNHEFTFDGQVLLQGAPPASMAWVAFFGDIEHEVALVTSGHRITITFNLYFDSNFGGPIPQATSEYLFKSELKKLIDDPLLSSAHPFLGFGLDYAYPFQKAILEPDSINLKGVDATLIRILNELEVDYDFYLLYRESEREDGCPFRVLSKNIFDGKYLDSRHHNSSRLFSKSFLVFDPIVGSPEDLVPSLSGQEGWTGLWEDFYNLYREGIKFPRLDVEWVTRPREENLDRSFAVIHGNEARPGYLYHFLCVVVKLSEPEEVPHTSNYFPFHEDISDPDIELTTVF